VTSRREEKQRLREERLRREREAAAAAERRRLFGLVAAGVLVSALVIVGIVLLVSGGGEGDDEGPAKGGGTKQPSKFPDGSVPPKKDLKLEDAARLAGCKLENPKNEGAEHVDTKVTYKSNPPTSGNHNPIPADDGAYYDDPPPKENLVHALEHGRIIVQFKPNAPDSLKGNLHALFEEDDSHMILTPNETNMPYEVAATAWDHLIGCPRMNDQVYDAIRAFKFRWRDKGPENVP
jgi:hypothetical protein